MTLKSRFGVIQGHCKRHHSKVWALGTVSYSHFIATMTISLAVFEIFSIFSDKK